jgi:hypothetical protein
MEMKKRRRGEDKRKGNWRGGATEGIISVEQQRVWDGIIIPLCKSLLQV